MTNWPEYDESLRRRGDITVWFDDDAAKAWNATSSGRPGGQRRYSGLAVLTALTLRAVFHLALRQTEGFVRSLIRLMGLDLRTPDHSTLSRRSATVEVPRQATTTRTSVPRFWMSSTRESLPSAPTGRALWGHRRAAVERIGEVGRRLWRKESGAQQRARAENATLRFKTIIGESLRSRTSDRQNTEASIGVAVLNRMTELGMPTSVPIRT